MIEPLEPRKMTQEEREREAQEDAAFYARCERRIPELAPGKFDKLVALGSADEYEHEYSRWCMWLEALDDMDGDALAADLADCDDFLDGGGWVEDERGGAVFIPYGDAGELPPGTPWRTVAATQTARRKRPGPFVCHK